MVTNDETNTLKIDLNKSKNAHENQNKEPHIEAYLFIIKKDYQKEILGKLTGGDFVYLQ